jgi:hypothetical protein
MTWARDIRLGEVQMAGTVEGETEVGIRPAVADDLRLRCHRVAARLRLVAPVDRWLLVYVVGLVSVPFSLAALRARRFGRRLQLRPTRQASHIPDAFTQRLCGVRNREPRGAERILPEGPLFEAANIDYIAVLAPALAIALIFLLRRRESGLGAGHYVA